MIPATRMSAPFLRPPAVDVTRAWAAYPVRRLVQTSAIRSYSPAHLSAVLPCACKTGASSILRCHIMMPPRPRNGGQALPPLFFLPQTPGISWTYISVVCHGSVLSVKHPGTLQRS